MSNFGLRHFYLSLARHADEAKREKECCRTQRCRRYALDAFLINDREFVKTYRLTKSLVKNLIAELNLYIPAERRRDGLDAATKVLIALSFFASGSYQTLVGQSVSHVVSQPSVSRAIQHVTRALNHPAVFNRHVTFPLTREARERIRNRFFTTTGIPGVLGCIDSTHVCIIAPSDHEEAYFCRKGYHSLNVMMICDADMNILCVDPSSPGRSHDSTVWRDHPLNPFLKRLIDEGEDVFLLGSRGYARKIFNEIHTTARNVIEHTIGILKARFRCLLVARQLHYKPKMAAYMVNACCVLHNIANASRLRAPELMPQEREAELRSQERLPLEELVPCFYP